MLKNKCCLYVIISIRFFSITICNLLIELPSYKMVNELDCVYYMTVYQIPRVVPCAALHKVYDESVNV
jgi:hypothetical protein